MTRRAPTKRAADHYHAQNRLAAGIILQDVQRYGGEGAGLVQWARTVLRKEQTK
jgi:hypothetical protein